MAVIIPWTKEDVDYLVREGAKDTYKSIKGNPNLARNFQKAANVVRDFRGDKYRRQELIDTYYDLVNNISKKTSEEWAKYEQEHAQQISQAQRKLSPEEMQLIAKNQEALLSRLYKSLGDRTGLRIGIEQELNKKLPDKHHVGELFESWGLSPAQTLIYCIGKRHAEIFSEIEKVSQEMQNQIKEGNKYYEGNLLYLNQLLDHVRDIKKENSIPGIAIKYSKEINEKLVTIHETAALYGTKCLEAICNEEPGNILRDDTRTSFKRIKNITYKNAINISSIALSAEMIKAISSADDKYQRKTQEFTPELLKEQDRLYSLAQKAAEHPNIALFSTRDRIIDGGLLGNLLVFGTEIDTRKSPVFSSNPESYETYKREFEELSRNYGELLEEDEADLKKALAYLDSEYARGKKRDIVKCIIKNGKARILPTEQELTELSDIYTKLIRQSAEKAREAAGNKDAKKAREYLDMARGLLKEKEEDVDSLWELVKPEEPTKGLEAKVSEITEMPKPQTMSPIIYHPEKPKTNFLDNPTVNNSKEEIREDPNETPGYLRPASIARRAKIKKETQEIEGIHEKYREGMIVSYNHSLNPEDAYQRASNLLGELQREHSKDIKDARISWNEDKTRMNFNLKVRGIPVEGEAYLIGNEIFLGGKLSLLARPFKGQIEKAIREKLEETFS